jgi:mannose-6-phosphate isomerase-like protein (cupin superfamily)/DNA-binding XRE family transcriptional regulator
MEIGERLKGLRLQKAVTLAELSKVAGVSKSMLSRIERNESAPTITSLEKIARALDVDLPSLFVGAGPDGDGAGAPRSVVVGDATRPDTTVSVVRGDRRRKVIMPWGADYEMLCPDMRHRIEFILIRYPVNGGSGELYSHEGEECGVVVEGRFRGIVGDEEFVLEAGDSIYYASSIPHRWENAGDVEAKAIWAITPPSFLLGKMNHE